LGGMSRPGQVHKGYAMSDEILKSRSGDCCELCGARDDLAAFDVAGGPDGALAWVCTTCRDQLTGGAPDPQHWRALSGSMWSEHAPVQVLAWRMLDRLRAESWAAELLDQLWLDDDTRIWAEAERLRGDATAHRDANGVVLEAGDTVTLIKDLPVKGAGFTAKRGTAVRGISLVADNAAQIEGRVEGQRIVILTEFVKKR